MDTEKLSVFLDGKEYEATKVGFGMSLDLAKKAVLREFMTDVSSAIEEFELSGKDKVDFIDRRIQSKPKGEELSELAIDWTGTPEGVSAILLEGLKTNKGMSKKVVDDLLEKATSTELSEAVSTIQGGYVAPSKNSEGETSTS